MKWIKRKPKLEIKKNDDILVRIAKTRGIPEDELDTFLMPTENELFDARDMKNVQKAISRIKQAILNDEKIVISFDPDADGVTSGALLVRYLRSHVNDVEYIYSQREDGHGISSQICDVKVYDEITQQREDLNKSNIEKIVRADLLIIADSSSNDYLGCKKIADNIGTDMIILDHHNIEEDKDASEFAIIVNPQQEGDDYPNKCLSGVGVIFKVLELVDKELEDSGVTGGYVSQYYDLVAVGMLGDMMDMSVLENRYMVMQGLNNFKNVGLLRILKGAKINKDYVKGDDIGYTVSPMINGSARMGQIELPIELLLEDDDKVAMKIRLKMHKLNEERKKLQESLSKKYESEVNTNDKIIIITDTEGNKGFNGLVAQSLAQKYQRPVFVVRDFDGMMRGSGRSYGKLDTQDLLKELDWVVTQGHAQSHGIDFPSDKLGELKEFINKNMDSSKSNERVLMYDFEVSCDEASEYLDVIETYNFLTGQGFPKVLIKVTDILVNGRRVMGEFKNTVKLESMDDLELIKFKVDEQYAEEVDVFDEISAIGELSLNVFYNFATKETKRTPQLKIEDYRKV